MDENKHGRNTLLKAAGVFALNPMVLNLVKQGLEHLSSRWSSPRNSKGKKGRRGKEPGAVFGSSEPTSSLVPHAMVDTYLQVSRPNFHEFAGRAKPVAGLDNSESIRVAGRSVIGSIGNNSGAAANCIFYEPINDSTFGWNTRRMMLVHPKTMGAPRLSKVSMMYMKYAVRHIRITVLGTASSTTFTSYLGLFRDPARAVEDEAFLLKEDVAGLPNSVMWNDRGMGCFEISYGGNDVWNVDVHDKGTYTEEREAEVRQVFQAAVVGTKGTNVNNGLAFGDIILDYVVDFYESDPTPYVGVTNRSSDELKTSKRR